jgi:hypothetical protein
MKQLKQQGLLGGQKEPRYAQGGMVYSPKTINQMSLNLSTNQSKEPRYAQGGMVQSPMQLSKMPLRAKNITPPSAPPVLVSTTSKTSTTMPSIPSSPGVPKAPSFNSIHSNNERKRILAIHGVA